jgi:tetratricopeptide (TPR) repeat protein
VITGIGRQAIVRGGLALLVAGALTAVATPARTAPPPPELPLPELPLTADLVPLPITRTPVEPPPPLSALRARATDLVAPPLPQFESGTAKPLPPAADPGLFSCGLAAIGHGATNLTRCGLARALRGENARARESFEESLRVEPTGSSAAVASLWLAELALRDAKEGDARTLYRNAIDLGLTRDQEAGALASLAWLALRRAEVPRAEAWIKEALALEPSGPTLGLVRFLDGTTRLSRGRAAEALAQWERLEREGGPAELLAEVPFWRGVAMGQIGDTDAAVRWLDRFRGSVKADHPLTAPSLAQRGFAQLVRGMIDAAQKDFLAAEAASPSAQLALQLDAGLARTYLIRGQYVEARERTRRLGRGKGEGPLVEQLLLQAAEEALRRNAAAEAIETYRQLRDRPIAGPLRAFATYRIAETLERLYRETRDEARLREAGDEYRRLKDEGGDEGLVQRATYWLALRELQDGRPGAAFREGQALLQAGVVPDLRPRVVVLTAEAAARAKDPNRAKALFRQALGDPQPAAPIGVLRLALGWALRDDGEPESALQEWQIDADQVDSPVRVAAWAAIAKVALDQGHDELARRALTTVVTLAPTHPARGAVLIDEGVLRLRAGDLTGAVDTLRLVLVESSLSPELQSAARRLLGLAWYEAGEYGEALAMFTDAIRVDQGRAENWLGAGLAALLLGRADEADRALPKARLASDPELATTAAYAYTLVRKDDLREFERRAGTFVAAYPTHPYAGILMARMVADAIARGQVEIAYNWVKSLLQRQADEQYVEDALVRLAESDYKQPELAVRVYRDVIGRVRDRAARLRARLGLAQAALVLSRPSDAREALEGFLAEAPADDPRLPWVELRRGDILLNAQRWDAAREALEAARSSGLPTVAPEAHVRLGDLARARAEYDQAIEDYLGATYLYPATPWAALGLQGAARSYLDRRMTREGRILLEKLARRPGVDPQLVRWARDELAKLPPVPVPTRPRPPAPTRS